MVVPSTEESTSNAPTNTEVSVVNDTSATTTTTNATTPSTTTTTTTTWTSSLIFPNCVLCPKSKTYQEYIQDVCDIDIFQYTASSTNHRWLKSWIIRFNPQVYVVHPDQKEHPFAPNTDGWKLVHDIISLLRQNGNGSFVSNGGKNIRHHRCQREICCSRYRLYRRPKPQKQNNNNNNTSPTSQTTTVNTTTKTPMMMKKKKKKKHTYTTLPLHKNEKCTCRIVIQVDTNSYYMDCGVGMATHVYHPRSNIDPTTKTTMTVPKQPTPRNVNVAEEEDDEEEEEEKEEEDDDDFPSNHNDHEEEEEDNNDHMPWTDTITPPNTIPTTNTAVMGTLFPLTVNHHQQHPPDPLVVVWEHLHSLLYYCNEEYCHHIQQEMMDMITRTQQYIHHQQQRAGRR